MKQTAKLNLSQNPNGTWSFVGLVPNDLAFTSRQGGPADPKQIKIAASFGARLADVKTRTWATREAAVEAAKALGFEVNQ